MAEILSAEWANQLKEAWNAEPEVKDKLAEINFTSTICAGFKDEENPRMYFKVENGTCVEAGTWSGQQPNWDMRASKDDWLKWTKKELGMGGMTMAVTTGKLKFKHGDFKSMIKDPRMAGPFVKSFGLMKQIGGE
jgi:putative sterol carrier protein